MKQLLILSGKGGTGKTTVAAAFIRLAETKANADCDVDAPNLHLVMRAPGFPEKELFYGLDIASIDPRLCIACGACERHCRFGAIKHTGMTYVVAPFACEGCGVCEVVCPEKAVQLVPDPAGKLYLYTSNDAVFSTARLRMGKGNSGLLVSKVKERMQDAAPKGTNLAVIDGSPGIGCPVIASMRGVDMVLIVAEPSVSGISDMERIMATARKFAVPMAVCVNKHSINLAHTTAIEEYCQQSATPFVGKIPFDTNAISAVNKGISIVDLACPAGDAVRTIFDNTIRLLKTQENNHDFTRSSH